MTAIAAIPAPAAPRVAAATNPSVPSANADLFDRQLNAAQQQHVSTHEPAHAPVRKSTQEPTPEPVSKSAAKPAGKSTSEPKDGQMRNPAHATSAAPATPAAPSLESAAATPNSDPADTGSDDADDGDQATSALAGNMLALLGLSAGVTLGNTTASIDGGAAASVSTGKASIDGSAGALLQMNGVDSNGNGVDRSAAAAAISTVPVSAGMQLAGDDTKSPAVDKAADTSGDLTSVLALPVPITTAAPASVHQLQLPSPVGSQAFAQELGQQVTWLGDQDIKQARIRLHPEDLGQLDIKVSVTHDRVDVVFSAQHPAAVTAVQQSLSQLGQMLTQQGLSLGHAEVGQHDRGANQGNGGTPAVDAITDDTDEVHGSGQRATMGTVGLLDAFA
ncbi:MAG: flagellar hook-length control protein FliK [Rhodanobacter sp.]